MSDTVQPAAHSAREDIAFMRNLAEQGANRPIFGGAALVAAGLVYSAACAANWLVIVRPIADPGVWTGWIWGTAVAVQILAVSVMRVRFRGLRAGPIDRTNRVFAFVWKGVGLAIMSCLASFFLAAWIGHELQLFAATPTVILALYGVGWTATASSSNERWTWGVAILSYLLAIASGALIGNVNLVLLFAPALLLLLALPGAMLIKRASVRS